MGIQWELCSAEHRKWESWRQEEMFPTVPMLMLKMRPSLCQMQEVVPVVWGHEDGSWLPGCTAHWDAGSLPAQHRASRRPWGQEVAPAPAPAPHPRRGPAASGRVFARGGVRTERCGLEPEARQ